MHLLRVWFAVASLLAALGCATLPKNESPVPNSLTIVCYNIRIGSGPEGPFGAETTDVLQRIGEYLRDAQPDIVLLQEVDRRTERVRGVDQLQFLAEATGMHAAWGGAMDVPGGGEYGIAILSRHPVRDVAVHQLFRPDYSESHPDWPGWYAEQRVALTLVADTPMGAVQVLNTHLGVTEDQRARQLPQLARIAAALDPSLPIIAGGDLNGEPSEPALDSLRAVLPDGWQLLPPAQPTFSERTIDYLFVRGATLLSLDAPEVPHSDHRPVVGRVGVG